MAAAMAGHEDASHAVRPAVVVRRRVYDATVTEKDSVTPPRAFTGGVPARVEAEAGEDEESGPPSSINVARALASLRSDELQRVEELVRADEDESEDEDEDAASVRSPAPSSRSPRSSRGVAPVPSASAGPASARSAPAKPRLMLGRTIALSELARRMGVSAQELPATLVARGFYALDAKTVLPRETARVIAEMHGWQVEDLPVELDDSPPVKSETRSRIATKRKVERSPRSRRRSK